MVGSGDLPAPVNVLLVDDDPASLFALEAVLTSLGQNLIKAASGEEALRLMLDQDFAAVLLDVQMRGLDGFGTAKLIRGRERTRRTPIIFLSAYESPDFPVSEAYSLGAVDYLLKPLVPQIVRAKVAVFVELFQKTEDLRRMQAKEFERQLVEERQRWEVERLRQEARQKDQFLSMLAHELRNPLTPALGSLHLLRQTRADASVGKQALEMLERQLRHLNRLVDDLLDVSRISRSKIKLRLQRVDLSCVIRTAVEDRRGLFERAGLELVLELPETPIWVMGDDTRLAQVLTNLLENAVKFTDGGGAIYVRATTEGDRAVFTVRDTGIGIEPELLGQLFDVFIQADKSLDRSRGGLGLGLSVVKGLVELHGGEVRAASAGPDRGAEFTVVLPLEREPAALSAVPREVHETAEHLRVVVIEDNRDAAESLRILLGLLGHEVAVAYSGHDGVATAMRCQPDVVISDIGLPGLDGYGVARELRRHPAMAAVRLIAVTGYGSAEDCRRVREAGFDHHLVKPADPMALERLLQRGRVPMGDEEPLSDASQVQV